MDEVKSILNNALVLLFNLVLKSEEKFLREVGCKDLSINEIHVIDAIGKKEDQTMGWVAGELNVTLGTLTKAINNLEKKEYVKRKRSTKDRRVVFLALTDEGRKIFSLHQEFHDNMINEIVENLSKSEERALMKGLNNLIDYFMTNYNN
ncbi:MarR family winged helix-turn-helix transcriptional regulator [Alkalibacter saccharofermentans]|uniref:HTH-type transcriptional regulator MgrA n=1 Tax=Alkalibacter saccharofermentans DSM 14828 TaxID=1120975 RepID=A0A1M4X9Y2_9FIRM|nr:MarR family transcriptional regulator [Alkalibacter saccharofermentans]SHE89942.1 DNA-binding transcriptional regulator, MarR family [Alkalibacter saccharofermentans DSM 14828]